MRLYVPEIGDRLRLASDWSFDLHTESRNRDLITLLHADDPDHAAAIAEADRIRPLAFEWRDVEHKSRGWMGQGETTYTRKEAFTLDQGMRDKLDALNDKLQNWPFPTTLPAGTELTVDRIYIRKGASDYSSLSFWIVSSPHPLLKTKSKGVRKRFWAKLADCNTIEFDQVIV